MVLRLALPPRLRHRVGRGEFAIALLLPAVASLSPGYAVFAIAVMLIIAAAPAIAGPGPTGAMDRRLQLLVFALPLLPILHYTATVSTFTVAEVESTSFLCAGAIGALLVSNVRAPGGRLRSWDLTFIAMMLAQLFMDTRDNDLMFTLRMMVQMVITLGIPYFIISRAAATAHDPAQLLISLLFAACILAALAVTESYRSWLLYDHMIARVGADPETISGYTKMRGGLLRGRASFPESTGLSLFLGVALAVLVAVRRHIDAPRLFRAMALLLIAGLVVSLARVGYLAAGAGLVMVILFERRFALLLGLAGAVPPIVAAMLWLGHAVPIVGASLGLSRDSAVSVSYRSELLAAGQRLIAENPFFGLGIHDLMARLDYLRQGEGIIDFVNQPLTILMRAGIIGALVYYAMMLRVMARFWGYRGPDTAVRAAAAGCFAGLGALFAGLLTTSYGRNDLTFVILLAMGAGIMARRAVAAQPKSAANSRFPAAPVPIAAPATPSIISS